MTIPAELKQYKVDNESENNFIQKFLIPLLQRLGFSVVNYHGKREFGRDLIFSESDRFGEVRFLAMQAKYESSLSQSDSHDLIKDCREAFSVPFTHPISNLCHRISAFYVANAGDISDTAREFFFQSLQPTYGDNARLFDGKALLALDGCASITRREMIGETISGLLMEIRINRGKFADMLPGLTLHLSDEAAPMTMQRLLNNATKAYLIHPVSFDINDFANAFRYSEFVSELNQTLDLCILSATLKLENKKLLLKGLIDAWPRYDAWAGQLESNLQAMFKQLGPIAGAKLETWIRPAASP